MRGPPSGMTLIEVLIAVVLLGILMSVTVPGSRRSVGDPSRDSVQEARGQAVQTGRRARIVVQLDSVAHIVTADPDGSVLVDSLLDIDRLSGVRKRYVPAR